MKRESEEEHPEIMKWALQILYFDGQEWLQICRIDNYLHDSTPGSHIHIIGSDEIKRVPLSFEEAEKEIIRISSRILEEKFNEMFGEKT